MTNLYTPENSLNNTTIDADSRPCVLPEELRGVDLGETMKPWVHEQQRTYFDSLSTTPTNDLTVLWCLYVDQVCDINYCCTLTVGPQLYIMFTVPSIAI